MVEKTDEINKPMYLCQFCVPFEALAYVFGRNPMYWYRIYLSLGRASTVGTTIKAVQKLPKHLFSDEKQTWLREKMGFLCTTVAKSDILGVGLTDSASSTALTEGYREFQTETRLLDDPNYAPITVNTDAWERTQPAWQTLFPKGVLVVCFLSDFFKIQS